MHVTVLVILNDNHHCVMAMMSVNSSVLWENRSEMLLMKNNTDHITTALSRRLFDPLFIKYSY